MIDFKGTHTVLKENYQKNYQLLDQTRGFYIYQQQIAG